MFIKTAFGDGTLYNLSAYHKISVNKWGSTHTICLDFIDEQKMSIWDFTKPKPAPKK